jgi:outer membrane protein assembly factor BamB
VRRLPFTEALVVAAVAAALLSIPAHAATAVLFGDQAVEPGSDSNSPGKAEAFRVTASTSGSLTSLTVYVDSASTATSLVAGVYANSGSHPGALLAQGTVSAPTKGAWNTLSVPAASITSGATYWIALLAPGGTLRFRDKACGCGSASETSSQTTLTTLPTSWTTGSNYADGPVSAYASGTTSTQPILSISPSSLSFGATEGGPDPPAASLAVTNTGSGSLSFTAAADVNWISLSPTNGTAPQTVTVTASSAGLAAGSYTGNVTVTAAGAQGSPATVPVTLTVSSPGTSVDWPMVDHDPGRTGAAVGEATISPSSAPNLALSWSTGVDGKVTAQPLYLKGVQVGGQNRDVVIAATSANSVYALDASTGAVLWRRNFGAQAGNCAIPGGFGVTGAPVVNRAAARVYAVADDGTLRTLALADGSDAAPAVQVVAGAGTNKVWGGLNLVGSNLYIATASDGCDTAPWRGQVYRLDVSGAAPRVLGSWTVVPGIAAPSGGAGIWGYGGVSGDNATGRIFAATGADSNERYAPYADRMVALDGSLNLLGSFEPAHPSNYPCNGAPCDVDFGATPLVFQPAGCPTLVAAGNKDGNLYVLRASDLASSSAPLQTLALNAANDWLGNGGIGGVPAFWASGGMVYVTDAGAGITGVAAGVVGLKVQSDCTLKVAWSAALGGNSQPNSTPTVANGVVFVGEGNGGRVHAYDATTGAHLWDSGAASGGATYAAPIVAEGKLFIGSWNGTGTADAGTVRAFAPSAMSVTMTAPSPGSTVSGAINVSASTSGPVTGVQFLLDGSNLGSEDTSSPWSVSWNTTAVADGSHTLSARAHDAVGATVSSSAVTVAVRNAGGSTLLLGDQTLYAGLDSNSPGTAEAFRTTAVASGTLGRLVIYVDSGSTATNVDVGIYGDAGGHPGTLLTHATATVARGAWNTIALPSASVASGSTYWIALLAPTGTLRFRDRACECANPSEVSAQKTLTALPVTWTTGIVYKDAPVSAYGTS